MRHRVGLTSIVALLFACTPAQEEQQTSGIATAPQGTDADDDDDDSDDDDEDDDDDDDDTTSGGNGFDTLTTAASSGPPDPTNTSEDTNETGASDMEIDPAALIDDLEDGDAVIYEQEGRIGVWYAYDDGTAGSSNPEANGGFLPTSGGPNGSSYAAHIIGGGFSDWGAGMGFDLNNSGGPIKKAFDASGFSGIAFQARGDVTIAFKVQTEAIVPTSEGGTCTAGGSCNDAYQTQVELSDTWQQFVIPFSSLSQVGWGQSATWDPTTLLGLQWEVAGDMGFEVVVDDVGFY